MIGISQQTKRAYRIDVARTIKEPGQDELSVKRLLERWVKHRPKILGVLIDYTVKSKK